MRFGDKRKKEVGVSEVGVRVRRPPPGEVVDVRRDLYEYSASDKSSLERLWAKSAGITAM